MEDARLSRALHLAALANELFIRDKDYAQAIQLYTQAIQVSPFPSPATQLRKAMA